MLIGFWWESRKERDQYEGGRIILKWILEKYSEYGGMEWIDMAQDREEWRALVNTVMNLRYPKNFGKLSSSGVTCDSSIRTQLHEVSWCPFIMGTHVSVFYILVALLQFEDSPYPELLKVLLMVHDGNE
jgi:hypothetical protein